MLSVAFNVGSCGIANTPKYCETCSPAQITAACILSTVLCKYTSARGPIRLHLLSRPSNLCPTQPNAGTECTKFIQTEACAASVFNSSRNGALTPSGSLDTSFSSPATQRVLTLPPVTPDKLCPGNSEKFTIIPQIALDLLQQHSFLKFVL